MENKETPEEAALREAEEETGLDVEITRFVGTYLIEERDEVKKSYLFEGRVIGGTFQPEFPGCKGEWFPVDKLPFSMPKRNKEKVYDCLGNNSTPFSKNGQSLTLSREFLLACRHPLAALKYIVYRAGR